jgi:hypothetical protein
LLNAIRTRDSGKFARSVRRTNADTWNISSQHKW